MDQRLLLFLCCCAAFMAGYGLRAMISQHRRREVRRIREARARLMEARASRGQADPAMRGLK